jgi:hypothetical protein
MVNFGIALTCEKLIKHGARFITKNNLPTFLVNTQFLPTSLRQQQSCRRGYFYLFTPPYLVMSGFTYAYVQHAALIRRPEGIKPLLAAHAEHTPASGAAGCLTGQLRESEQPALKLTILAKVEASRSVALSAALRYPLVKANAEQRRFEASSSRSGSLSNSSPSLPKKDCQHSTSLSSVLFCATMRVAANPTA